MESLPSESYTDDIEKIVQMIEELFISEKISLDKATNALVNLLCIIIVDHNLDIEILCESLKKIIAELKIEKNKESDDG